MKQWNRREILSWLTGSAYAAALPIAIPAAGLLSFVAFDHRRFRLGLNAFYKIHVSLPDGQTADDYMANLPNWLNAKAYDELKASYEKDGRIGKTTKEVVGRELHIAIEFHSNRDLMAFERDIMALGLVKSDVRRNLGYFVREELVIRLG